MGARFERFIGVFRVAQEEYVTFLAFIFVNLFFGALGIWLPPVLASQDLSANSFDEFIKALRAGNGYLFSLALLSASSVYMLREYLSSEASEFKEVKTVALLASFALAVLMSLFLGPYITSQFEVHGEIKRIPVSISALIVQLILTFLSLVCAVFLFCLEMIDSYPEYGFGLKDKERKKMNKDISAAADPNIVV